MNPNQIKKNYTTPSWEASFQDQQVNILLKACYLKRFLQGYRPASPLSLFTAQLQP